MLAPRFVIHLLLGILFAVTVFGPFMLMATMGTMESGCLFMPHETSFCTMTAADHIVHWQQAFASTLTQFFSVIDLVILAVALISIIPRLNDRARLRQHRIPIPTLFERLFSQGILNSKAH